MTVSIDDEFNEYSVARKIGLPKFKVSDCYLEGRYQEGTGILWEIKTLRVPLIKGIIPLLKKVFLRRKIIRKKAFQKLLEETLSPLLRVEPKRASHPVTNNRYFQFFAKKMICSYKTHPHTSYFRAIKMLLSLSNGFQVPKEALLLSNEFWNELFAYTHISKAPPFYPNDPEFKKEHRIEQEIRAYDVSVINTIHLSEDAAKLYEVNISEGIFLSQGKPFDSSHLFSHIPFECSSCVIFTLGIDSTLYIARPEVFKFNHSSCLRGGPCLAAGELKTNSEGQLIEINSHSGHYKPQKEHFLFFLRFLKKNGVDLKSVKLTQTFGDEFSPIFNSAEKYFEKRGRLKEDGWQFKDIEAFYAYRNEEVFALHFYIEFFSMPDQIFKLLQHILKTISFQTLQPPEIVYLEVPNQFSIETSKDQLIKWGVQGLKKELLHKLSELRNKKIS